MTICHHELDIDKNNKLKNTRENPLDISESKQHYANNLNTLFHAHSSREYTHTRPEGVTSNKILYSNREKEARNLSSTKH
jgi:hypothetical protein